MHAARRAWSAALAALAMTLLLPAALDSSRAHAMPVTPQGVERKAILDALRAPVSGRLGQTVEFVVSRIGISGRWAFVIATPQRPGGAALDWQKTICRGDVSHLVGGLLERTPGGWTVRALALCPTDVAWEDWPRKYGAPAELFR